jgi:hypothetical protein
MRTRIFWVTLLFLMSATVCAQQVADSHFDARVEKPAFSKNYPRVLFDQGHYNFDTTDGRYKPFADLIFNDGYQLAVNRKLFTRESLRTFKILVIVNPLGAEDLDDEGADGPAFTADECKAVDEWVRDGGALLLVADSAPFSSAAEILALRIGVEMSKGVAMDQANADKELNDPSFIVYSRENHLLAENSITNGRGEAERINRVIVFGGQSLKGPTGSDPFLKLADTAVDKIAATEKGGSAAGRAQGIALRLGKGRVVVLADAAMISAQVTGSENTPVGMNVAGSDNKQLTLNIMHWLSGILK